MQLASLWIALSRARVLVTCVSLTRGEVVTTGSRARWRVDGGGSTQDDPHRLIEPTGSERARAPMKS